MTPEQQKAIAIASARKRMAEAQKQPKTADDQAMADRIAAAKAGTLKVSPERAARQAAIDAKTVTDAQDPSAIASFGGKVLPGMTFGFADELAAGIGSLVEDRSYGEILQGLRDREARLSEANPVAATLGEVAGAVAVPGVAGAKAVGAAPGLGAQVAAGATTGAAGGALYGFGAAEGGAKNRASGALSGAIGGAVVGGAIPAAAALVRKALDGLAKSQAVQNALSAAPDAGDLKAAASRIYAQADKVDNLPRGQFATAVDDMVSDATRKGLDVDLTPGAAKVASRLADAADGQGNLSFRELDILRKKAGVPAGNVTNRTEQSIASRMIEGIDEFVDSVDPSLSGAIKEARDTWATLRRSELVEKAIDKAKNTASGFENGIRIEFRKILNNPKLLRGFNEAEIAAMKRVVQGTAFGNLMRQVGRLGLGISGQSNGLMATIGGIAGTAAGGPIGGLATVAGGTVAKMAAERSTQKAAENALRTILARRGLESAVPQALLPGAENAFNLLGFSALPQASGTLGEYILGR